jgi:hypothetical protein
METDGDADEDVVVRATRFEIRIAQRPMIHRASHHIYVQRVHTAFGQPQDVHIHPIQ